MLHLENIEKEYEGFSLSGITLSVEPGEYFILLGESGAGKSLLLEIVAGLVRPDKGKIILNGRDITNEKIQKRKVGLVFQDYAVFPHLSVKENIAYTLKTEGLPKQEIREKTGELVEMMGISQLLHRSPVTLSGGELQRVALARTLALRPDILLLDEPLSSLDVQLRSELRSLLRKLNRNGQTIMHVTHDYEEAISLGNRLAVMDKGQILQTGTPEEVFHHPKTDFIARFAGIKNFFPAVAVRNEKKNTCLAKLSNNITIEMGDNGVLGEGFVMIPAEDIVLMLHEAESSARNNLHGTILELIPTMRGIEVLVDTQGIVFAVLITRESVERLHLDTGMQCTISFKAMAVRFIS